MLRSISYMSDKLTRDGLEKHLHGVADILRKRLDPPEYRPLIMTLLYIKRLSDTFEEKIDHLIKVEKRSILSSKVSLRRFM